VCVTWAQPHANNGAAVQSYRSKPTLPPTATQTAALLEPWLVPPHTLPVAAKGVPRDFPLLPIQRGCGRLTRRLTRGLTRGRGGEGTASLPCPQGHAGPPSGRRTSKPTYSPPVRCFKPSKTGKEEEEGRLLVVGVEAGVSFLNPLRPSLTTGDSLT